MGPWARAFLDRVGGGESSLPVEELRIEPSLITARVNGERVTLSADPIPPGIWAALDPIDTRVQSEPLAQTLEHTWEEPLIPKHVGRMGSDEAVAAVANAVAEAMADDPGVLLRWRGYASGTDTGDAWRGGELPPLPPPARRPPDSVPKRFGTSGVNAGHGADLAEVMVQAYGAFGR